MTMDNLRHFKEHYQLANRLIGAADKDLMAEVARVLAVHVAHYKAKYGAIPMEETLAALHSDSITEEQAVQLGDAMEYLVAVIGVVGGAADDSRIH
jgi:hypothetical protein